MIRLRDSTKEKCGDRLVTHLAIALGNVKYRILANH